jgi:hypothetical protein
VGELDDPAIRLWAVMRDLLNNSPQGGEPIGSVLAQRLGMRTSARAFAAMMKLFTEIEEGLTAVHGPSEVGSHLFVISPIEQWLSGLDLRQPWRSVPLPDEHAVEALKVCSFQLRTVGRQKTASEEEVATLREQAQNLLDDVVAAAIPQELARFLTGHLHRILVALDNYRITGSGAVVDELHRTLGDFRYTEPAATDAESRGLLKRCVEFLGAVMMTVSTLGQVAELPAKWERAYEEIIGDPAVTHEPRALGPGDPPAIPERTGRNPRRPRDRN